MAMSSPLGLTLRFFKHFVEAHGGRESFHGRSTADVCNDFVKPYTASTQLSLVEHVHQTHPHYVHPATWVVNPAWDHLFLDVVDAWREFFDDPDEAVSVMWVGMSTANHHHHIDSHELLATSSWAADLHAALAAGVKVVLVLRPWHSPTTEPKWGLFEMYVAIATRGEFQVTMGKTQTSALLDAIQDDDRAVWSFLTAREKANKVVGTHVLDEALTAAQLALSDVDRMLFDVLHDWILLILQEKTKTTADDEKAKWVVALGLAWMHTLSWDKAQQCLEYAIGLYQRHGEGPALFRAWMHLGDAVHKRGQPQQVWEPLLRNALDRQIDHLGKDHFDTLDTMNKLGVTYINVGAYQLGMPLLLEWFEIGCQKFGDESEVVLEAMAAIARGYLLQHQGAACEPWAVDCVERMQRTLGDDDSRTCAMQDYVAMCYTTQGKYRQAAPVLQAVYETRCRVHGCDHLFAWGSYCLVGENHQRLGEIYQAKEILLACMDAANRFKLSPLQTFAFSGKLGITYLCAGDVDKARTILRQAHDDLVREYGATYPASQAALYVRCFVDMTTHGWTTLAQLSEFESLLLQAECAHERPASRLVCHGCARPVCGTFFTCSKCPSLAWCFCGPCACFLDKPRAFCDHGAPALVTITPPARFIQEERLALLAQDANWSEYAMHFEAYQAYCATHDVPAREQVDDAAKI
ncbi:hypothetical protein As57867_015771, partial [Aphanomyces stellatus]